jgi:hypothetical protein
MRSSHAVRSLPPQVCHHRQRRGRVLPASAMAAFGTASLPLAVMTDSYKACHPLMYPDAVRMVAYGEFRKGFRTAVRFCGLAACLTATWPGHARHCIRDPLHCGKLFGEALDSGGRGGLCALLQVPPSFFSSLPPPAHWRRPAALTTPASRNTPSRVSCSRSLCAIMTVRRPVEGGHLGGGGRPGASGGLTRLAGYFPVRLQALPEGTVVHANCPVYQVRLVGYLLQVTWALTLTSLRLRQRVSTPACALSWRLCSP